jgi:hypothetical protein
MFRHALVAFSMAFLLVVSVNLTENALTVAAQPDESIITGCLQRGANDGEFILAADDKQTYRIQPVDGVELAAHANHRVELTGTVEKTETDAVVKASALKMVATSCES